MRMKLRVLELKGVRASKFEVFNLQFLALSTASKHYHAFAGASLPASIAALRTSTRVSTARPTMKKTTSERIATR